MKTSKKISVKNIVEFCQKHGVKDIVISPGSRNAPFTISFTNNPYFNCYSIVDERSASHFALGIAQQKRKPVAIVCTSGTATLNYAPAIAEAHLQGIPLLVLTADRQQNGLEIGDGQTINQVNLYQNFCDFNYNLIEDENDPKGLNSAVIQEAFYGLIHKKKTVHINTQLSEPLYETEEVNHKNIEVETQEEPSVLTVSKKGEEFISKWNSCESKLILISQNQFENLQAGIEKLMEMDKNVLVLTETTGDVVSENFISCIDRTIELVDKNNPTEFIPEMIVTIGHSVISKKIKQLFRANKPKTHWSFSKVKNENLFELDDFEKLNQESDFLSLISSKGIENNDSNEFSTYWKNIKNKATENHITSLENTLFSDLKAFEFLTKNLPSCNLQMGNSSVVRYIQLFDQREDIIYSGNRGVSGIEGSTSTALGAHQVTENTILISGDISFFYDSNAFWNNHVPNNFKVIVINNGEGNIFKILPHPQKDETSLPFFTTPNNLSIKKFCDLYDLKFFKAENEKQLTKEFNNFIEENNQASVLEINTSQADNDTILKEYFNYLKQNDYVNTNNGK